MRTTTKLIIVAVMGMVFTGVGAVDRNEGQATAAVEAQQASPAITITVQEGEPNYVYAPAQLSAKAGEPITITNNDPYGIHSVTGTNREFSVDVPPNGSVTLTIDEAGSYPYYCIYHPTQHNEASITVS